jgi:hypothetical protein
MEKTRVLNVFVFCFGFVQHQRLFRINYLTLMQTNNCSAVVLTKPFLLRRRRAEQIS